MAEPCKNCGYCPTCGRSNQLWYQPWGSIIPPWGGPGGPADPIPPTYPVTLWRDTYASSTTAITSPPGDN